MRQSVGPPVNVISVDVEDYFHAESLAEVVSASSRDALTSRVEANTRRLLDLFDRHGVEATFFVLGSVADRYPALIREIAAAGHELACHSYWHRLIHRLQPDEFRDDTTRAKDVIEQTAGVSVEGYRAPTYSLVERSLWAAEILAELGFTYDSSIFPVRHDRYGIPHAPRHPFRMETPSGPIVEFPIATFRSSPPTCIRGRSIRRSRVWRHVCRRACGTTPISTRRISGSAGPWRKVASRASGAVDWRRRCRPSIPPRGGQHDPE